MDFSGDLYGEEVRVDFIRYLREVRPFATVEALVGQIRDDVELARSVLAEDAVRPSDAGERGLDTDSRSG